MKFLCETSQDYMYANLHKRKEDVIFCSQQLWNEITKVPEITHEEFGCSYPLSFITSEGIKRMEPGKSYDKDLNENG